MVGVSVEVRSAAARFRVRVQASSIQGAVRLVKSLHSASDVRVVFPIDPEAFFVEDALAQEGLIEGSQASGETSSLRSLGVTSLGGRAA